MSPTEPPAPDRTPTVPTAVPGANPLRAHLERVHASVDGMREGAVAAYLSPVTPDEDAFGIALCTVDGEVYEVGDTRSEFSIQSVSKPFTYALALTECGFDTVDPVIDVEPSGEAYNQISLEAGSGRPANAMINAGAIAATALVSSPAEGRRAHLRAFFSTLADRPLRVSAEVAALEAAHGHRNLALAHLMRSFGLLPHDRPESATGDYFEACATMVTARDLAVMAGCLAAGGAHPLTGEQVIDSLVVQRVLSVMSTCGMYDDAGRWMVTVGMPGKSGVGGGIVAVLPGHVAIAVWSPRLDEHGTSVRGLAVCQQLSADLGLHMMTGSNATRVSVRRDSALHEHSDVQREAVDQERLARLAEHVRVVTWQGRLVFAPAEQALRELAAVPPGTSHIVLDVRRVTEVVPFLPVAVTTLAADLLAAGTTLCVVDDHEILGPATRVPTFGRRREALAFVEDDLLRHDRP